MSLVNEAKQEVSRTCGQGGGPKNQKLSWISYMHGSLVRSGVDGQPAVAGVGVVEVDEGGDHGVLLEGEVSVVLVHRERRAGPGGLQVRLGVVLCGGAEIQQIQQE